MFHQGCGFFWLVCCFSSFFILPAIQWTIPKNWGYTSFFGKPPKISRYVTLPLAIPDKTRLHSWNICNVKSYQLHSLKIPETKTKATGNSNFFLITLGNSTSFLTNLWKFRLLFLRYPQKFHVLNPLPMFIFLLEQPNVIEGTQNKLETFSLLLTKVTFLKWKAKILSKLANLTVREIWKNKSVQKTQISTQ